MPSLDLAAALHAERHAAGGPDPLTPAAIGAMPAVGRRYDGHADDATTPGTYWLVSSSFTAALGYPIPEQGNAAFLTVKAAVAYVEQTVVSNLGETWRRVRWGGWQPWVLVGPHTATSVGAVPADDPRLLDTGWRKVELQNGWTGDLYMRRTGNVVHMIVMNVNGANATNANLYNSTPPGFRCGSLFPVYGVGPRTATNGSVDSSGAIGLTGGGFNQILRASAPSSGWTGGSASMVFTTTEPWPNNLPGTPA